MTRVERFREVVSDIPTPEAVKDKLEAGWRLVAVEWERAVEEGKQKAQLQQEVPFGFHVGEDCMHLEEDSTERQILMRTMELIVLDKNLTQVAEELNQQGFRTRQGSKWSPVSVFNLLPRLIEVGPRILSSEEWVSRRQRLFTVA